MIGEGIVAATLFFTLRSSRAFLFRRQQQQQQRQHKNNTSATMILKIMIVHSGEILVNRFDMIELE
jgi:hypothetical protein